ncbi:uncharacterized protein [Antedon mediterranea]|uniref:uncharacterized protein n=1 Tax=Antedon mediterranea TaxID=105859 RepID=UPI003AF572E4
MSRMDTNSLSEDPSVHQELNRAEYLNSQDSLLRVEISDIERSGEYFYTTGILRRCNQQVLKPYWRLLIFISWRPFARDRVLRTCRYTVWNVFYPCIITLLLLFSYMYSVLVCTSPTVVLKSRIIDLQSVNLTDLEHAHKREYCRDIFSISILPNILHFLVFLYGFWYIRIQENEQIYALIEQVFLQANPMQRGSVTQGAIIKSLRLILVCGALWTFSTVGINGFYLPVFTYKKSTWKPSHSSSNSMTIVLLVIELLGKTLQHLIDTAVVVNFTVQCEVIMYYMKIIGTRMQEKSSELKTIMNDILRVKQSVTRLNGPIGSMTSLCIFYFALRFVVGLSILINNHGERKTMVWIYWCLYCFIWFVIMIFPLYQAARVNATCDMYQQEGHEVRVFGYHSSTQAELDSFLLFITSAKLKVKLFCLPIKQAYICIGFVVGSFTLVILLLANIIRPNDLLFF